MLSLNISLSSRYHLEKQAFVNGVTMSWIIRCLIKEYRKVNSYMPVRKRPSKFQEETCRFGLYFYGDKKEFLSYCRTNGGEAGAFVRYLLKEWLAGRLFVDFTDLKSVKKIKKCYFHQKRGIASDIQIVLTCYSEKEFWPIDHEANIRLLKLGLSRRRHPL